MFRKGTETNTALGAALGLLCGLLALGPALKPGYLLFYDMVFVPKLAWSERTLGTDGSVPRAVPGDLVVATLSHLAPGWVVQKVLLLLVFVGAAAGAASFFRSRVGASAAAVAAAWNPYVGERLAIGHWGFLLGYACLPFLLQAVIAYRRDEPRGRARLLLWTLLTALTGSTGAVIGLLVTAAALLVPGDGLPMRDRLRRSVLPIAAFIVANSAWWYPFLFLAPRDAADPAGVEAFMSRADTPLGLVPSVLTGGGIWNRGVWFADRSSLVVALAALLCVVCVLGVAVYRWRQQRTRALTPFTAMAAAGVVGLVLACLSALPAGTGLVTWIVTTLPGGGLLRDSQKFVAPWVLTIALAAGCAAQFLAQQVDRAGAALAVRVLLVGAALLWPIATFAGMALGAGGRWQAAHYPESFSRMASTIEQLPPGRVAVFPWNLYRRYTWDGNVVALDPWQRLVSREVLVNDDLPLSGQTVKGESADAARVTDALRSGADVSAALRASGARYVMVQTDQPNTHTWRPDALTPIGRDGALRLYRVPGTVEVAQDERPATRWLGLVGIPLMVAAAAVEYLRVSRRIPRTRA